MARYTGSLIVALNVNGDPLTLLPSDFFTVAVTVCVPLGPNFQILFDCPLWSVGFTVQATCPPPEVTAQVMDHH